jgi:sugar phosphate isomerase/epimerase
MHPDTIVDAELYTALGSRLVLENMDARKQVGQTADALAELFKLLPAAGFCFDIAHAHSVDESMVIASELLDAFAPRLRHLHLSSLSDDLHHVPLTDDDAQCFTPLLMRCRDVPWILEAFER